MKKFLAEKSKIFFIVFLVLGFVLLLSCAVYATEYTNVHIFYQISSSGEVIFSREYTSDTMNSFTNIYLYDGFAKGGTPMTNEIARLIYDFQKSLASVNTFIVITGVIVLVAIAAMFLFSNHNRSVYYKSNLIVGIVSPSICIIFVLVLMIRNLLLMGTFNENYDTFNRVSVLQNMYLQKDASQKVDITSYYDCSSLTFVLYTIFFLIIIAYSIFMIVYTVFRYKDSTERRNQIIERAVEINV